MVEDNQIKAQISPFEIKTFDGQDGYVSMNQIVHKIDIGHITDIHFAILNLINEFEFMTSRQIYQMLERKGYEVKSQDKLNNKLDSLVKCKILTRYYFTSDEGKGIYRVYCLEKMGKYLLDTREEVECKWKQSDNTKPVAMIKKRLSGNQVIIAYLNKVKAFDSYIVKPTLNAKTLGKVFKTSGGCVKLKKNGKCIQFLFEVIRREDEWQKKFIDKMNFYKDFYDNFVTMDSGFESLPQLIFICEDDRHMAEVFKEVVTNKIEIGKINLYYTTDLKQNSDSLKGALTEFVLDDETRKYKAKTVELKLLD